MEKNLKKRDKRRGRRACHVRNGIEGSAEKPRLAVFRSNKHLAAQLIDDERQVTLFGIGTMSKEFKGGTLGRKSKESAREIGKRLAEHAKKNQIQRVVFDRRHYKYHGLIAAMADAAREVGLQF